MYYLTTIKIYYQSLLQCDISSGQSENISEVSVRNRQQIRGDVDVDKLSINYVKRKYRKSIYDSHVNDRENIKRFYLQKDLTNQ